MTNLFKRKISSVFFIAWISLLTANTSAASGGVQNFTEIPIGTSEASYHTELFNLLRNKKNIIDNKNYYKANFASAFDELIRQTQNSEAKKDTKLLKKRLLSGPASKARAMKDAESNKMYLYFDACQAHACDETKLGLLFLPKENRMMARLTFKNKTEFLGKPTPTEANSLEILQSDNPRNFAK